MVLVTYCLQISNSMKADNAGLRTIITRKTFCSTFHAVFVLLYTNISCWGILFEHSTGRKWIWGGAFQTVWRCKSKFCKKTKKQNKEQKACLCEEDMKRRWKDFIGFVFLSSQKFSMYMLWLSVFTGLSVPNPPPPQKKPKPEIRNLQVHKILTI